MRLEWDAFGVKLIGLRDRDRDIVELQFFGAKERSYALLAKLAELRLGNRVIEEASEVYIERKEDSVEVVERRLTDEQVIPKAEK